MWELHVRNPNFLQIDFTVDVKKDLRRGIWMHRNTILRRTSAVPLQTRSSPSSTNSSPAPAASTPTCGAGARRHRSPAGTTAASLDGITGQALVSHQAVETMDLNVHTVSYLCRSLIRYLINRDNPQKTISRCYWHLRIAPFIYSPTKCYLS